jgi:two-component system LytT family response regulator
MIKAIIVDDEANAREKLALLLNEDFKDAISVLALCRDGNDALAAIAEHGPDLVFLDVEMPRLSGFDVLRKIGKPSFEVIFTTAYDHYAIKAIRFAAIDYLLKPIDVDQLREAIERVREKRGSKGAETRVSQLMENTKPGAHLNTLSIPSQDGFVMVKLEEIVWLEASNFYTVVHLKGGRQLIATRTLKDFEEMLAGGDFQRIHRGHMINLVHLERYLKGSGGQVVMAGGTTLDVSRTQKDALMARLGR